MTGTSRTAEAAGATVLRVELGDRSYDVVVGSDLLTTVGARLKPLLPTSRVVVVTDETVAPLYLAVVQGSLDEAGVAHQSVVLPTGERTKDFAHLEHLCERILVGGIERSSTVLALGGGVVGDIAGFAAGILLRGLGYVQVPTTLLAQVDSAVGGKTGINSRHGKNLVGLFHQPRLVLADVGTLATLDRRQRLAGYAEVVKYGLIGDPGFFAWLEQAGGSVVAGDIQAQQRAVVTSCAAKAAVVAADEREAGQRALLNLGHTFGHALEAETGFGDRLLHGEAVAIGMVLAFDLSVRLGLCEEDHAGRVRRHLAAVGLPTQVPRLDGRPLSAAALLQHMTRDKKVRDGRLTFVLARGIGRAFVARDVRMDVVHALLRDAVAA
ncbi:MAG: 3-dehydroquinate synthase [Rhodospirillales bacterium]|nr:MAG: 3-dehydroquinate synthase [Rhodospirillales bacterium]